MPGRHSAAPARRAGRRRGPGARRARLVVAAAALAVLVSGGAWWLSPIGGAAGCDGGRELTLAAAPEIAPVVAEVVADLGADELGDRSVCGVAVTATDPDDALTAFNAGAFAPDLWLPDTSTWLQQLPRRLARRPARSVAASPVVLAGASGAVRPGTWLSALSEPDAALLDPRESGASVAALAALHAEAARGVTSRGRLSSWLVAEAQSTADNGVSDGDLLTAGSGRGLPRRFPTTEQRLLAASGSEPAVTVPRSGTTLLDYPLVPVASGDGARAATRVASALAGLLREPQAAQRLRAAGFRPPSGRPVDRGSGVGRVREVGPVAPEAVGEMLTTWTGLNADARMLAVLDVSGSMRAREGGATRVALTRDAMLEALRTMPGTWDIGVWAFSQGLGRGEQDHRALAPLQTLSAVSRGSDHRAMVQAAVRRLPRLVGGGTGLYDTTLAAYRDVAGGYLSDRFNSVVLLTDGRNEDSTGLGLRGLLGRLERSSRSGRPVPVITVGMGPGAGTAALQRIAEATGGASYVARDPRDIERILADAFLERVGWGIG